MLKLINQISSSSSRNFFRYFAATKKNETPKEKKTTRRRRRRHKKSPGPTGNIIKITEHLESIGSQSLVKEFSRKYLKIMRSPKSLYFADKTAAKQFIEMIEDDIVKGSSAFVVEINPGVGLLTENLLQTSVPKIHLYEPSPSFLLPTSRLQLLLNKNQDRLELRKHNLLKMWEAAFLDFKDGGKRLHELLNGTEKRKWEEEPYMKIIGAISNDTFIRQLLMSVIFQNTFVEYGRIVFYLVLSPSIWENLTASKESPLYKSRSVLFQVLFNYEKLGVLPRKAFLPWIVEPLKLKKESKIVSELKKLDCQSLYVVRFEPKANLFDGKLNQEDLLRFFYFVKHHLQMKQTRIIPALEKWIPHCGPRLIAHDLNIYSEFQQLSPEQILKLYQEFSSWPEFETSQFLACMTSYISRIEEAILNFDARFHKTE